MPGKPPFNPLAVENRALAAGRERGIQATVVVHVYNPRDVGRVGERGSRLYGDVSVQTLTAYGREGEAALAAKLAALRLLAQELDAAGVDRATLHRYVATYAD